MLVFLCQSMPAVCDQTNSLLLWCVQWVQQKASAGVQVFDGCAAACWRHVGYDGLPGSTLYAIVRVVTGGWPPSCCMKWYRSFHRSTLELK